MYEIIQEWVYKDHPKIAKAVSSQVKGLEIGDRAQEEVPENWGSA